MKTSYIYLSCILFMVCFMLSSVPAFTEELAPEKTSVETPQQRMERIGAKLVRFNSATHVKEYVFILDDESKETNAWADANGEIEMTIKMYDMFKHSDEELAFFLAHELAHINLAHYEGKKNLANALDAMSGNSDEKKEQLKLAFDRQQEASADKYAVLYLVRSGYSAMAAVRSFLTLKKYGYDYTPHKEKHTKHPTTSNRIEEAFKMVQEISEAISQYEYGLMYLAQGKYEEAAECFLEFLEIFPASKEGNTNLGICYSYLAIAAMNPPEYLYEFSVAKLDTGFFIKSLGIVALNPNYAEAQKAFKKALEVDTGYGEALNNLGLLYTFAGDTDLGISYLEKAMASDVANKLYLNNFGVASFIAGDPVAAELAFMRAAGGKSLAIAQYNRGRSLWDQGKKKEAAPFLTQYLALVPKGTHSETAVDMLAAAIGLDNDSHLVDNFPQRGKQVETSLAGIALGSNSEKLMAMYGRPEKTIQLIKGKGKGEVWQYFDDKLSFALKPDVEGQMNVQHIIGSSKAHTVLKTRKGVLIKDSKSRVLKMYGQPEIEVKEGPYEIWSYNDLGLGFFIGNNVVEKMYVSRI